MSTKTLLNKGDFQNDDIHKQRWQQTIYFNQHRRKYNIIKKIRKQYPSLKQLHIVFDEAEILIPLETGFPYNFSLNELREYIKPIAAATISHFAVDMDTPTQRYYG